MKERPKRQIVETPEAPAARGPYSQAVMYGDLLFISGVMPIDRETGTLVPGGIEAQSRQVLENMKAIVEAAGMTLGNVLKMSVFMEDLGDFARFNEIYGSILRILRRRGKRSR